MTDTPSPAHTRIPSLVDEVPLTLGPEGDRHSISTRRCPVCRRRLHPSAFGRHRHRVCETCRHRKKRAKRRTLSYRRQKAAFDELAIALNKRRSPETLLTILDAAAAEAGTDLVGLAKQIGQHLADPECSPAQRLKIARTLWHVHLSAMACVEPPSNDAETLCRQLHADYKLIPVIRRLLEDGTLTLDDVDPPPG